MGCLLNDDIIYLIHNTLVGLNFGVLIAWVVVSCITLPLLQLYVRRKQEAAEKEAVAAHRRAQEKRSPVVR